jgi:hypothetical protein
MKFHEKLLAVGVLAGLIFVTALLIVSNANRTEASVVVSNEYQATTTDADWNSQTCKAPLAATNKVLGSVIVTLTSNAPFAIYDATTTGPHSDHATTSIALFTTTTAGTYTFDVVAKRGICIVGASTVGVASTTITTRNQ